MPGTQLLVCLLTSQVPRQPSQPVFHHISITKVSQVQTPKLKVTRFRKTGRAPTYCYHYAGLVEAWHTRKLHSALEQVLLIFRVVGEGFDECFRGFLADIIVEVAV